MTFTVIAGFIFIIDTVAVSCAVSVPGAMLLTL